MSENATAFVAGRGREKAIALLAIAAELELPADVVRTTRNGYTVPVEVAKKFDETVDYEPASEAPEEEAPEAGEAPAEEAEEVAEAEEPAKNASLEAWVAYAEKKGYDTARGLTRNDLIEEYGQN